MDGLVLRGTRGGTQPVANHWVVLHRVGPDHAGPLDSTRTGGDGHFTIRYRSSGDSTAIYFVSTSYGGVAYFTPPLLAPVVGTGDATLTVFDTTSGPVAIKLGGRHLIVGVPNANGRRPIGEVYDLENDSTVTLIAHDSTTPVWRAHLPDAAVNFQLNTNGDIAAGAVSRSGSTVGLYVPLSPGIRQFAFTYELPASAFPLSLPAERPIGVLEVLVQEPTARVVGPKLREMAPVSTEGRTFRRFLGQDVPANAVIRVEVPRIAGAEREKIYVGVAGVLLLAMIIALVFAWRRAMPGGARPSRMTGGGRSRVLLQEIAVLDEAFEQSSPADDVQRADYESKRAALKAELRDVLAAERRSS